MRFVTLTLALLSAFASSATVGAVTFNEDFSGGIQPDRWDILHNDAAGAPWTVTAPDSFGGLQLSKTADSDPLTIHSYCNGGIGSRFQLIGDFSVSVAFNLVDFPPTNSSGWNEAQLCLWWDSSTPATFPGNDFFEVLRAADVSEGWSTQPPPYNQIGVNYDPITQGSFRITRSGTTLSAWIDRGAGFVLLGSETSTSFSGPANIEILADQVPDSISRPSTSLDVRFSELSVTAESIVPEPPSLILLGAGAIGLFAWTLRRKRHPPHHTEI